MWHMHTNWHQLHAWHFFHCIPSARRSVANVLHPPFLSIAHAKNLQNVSNVSISNLSILQKHIASVMVCDYAYSFNSWELHIPPLWHQSALPEISSPLPEEAGQGFQYLVADAGFSLISKSAAIYPLARRPCLGWSSCVCLFVSLSLFLSPFRFYFLQTFISCSLRMQQTKLQDGIPRIFLGGLEPSRRSACTSLVGVVR